MGTATVDFQYVKIWRCSLPGDVKLLVILRKALFYRLSIIITDQNTTFHDQVARVIGQVSI